MRGLRGRGDKDKKGRKRRKGEGGKNYVKGRKGSGRREKGFVKEL